MNNGQEYGLVLSTIRKYIYNIDKLLWYISFLYHVSDLKKAVLLTEISIKPQMAVKQCRN